MGRRLAVGSTNPVKVKAVKRAAEEILGEVEVVAAPVPSGVSEVPKGEEVFRGAENRAKGVCNMAEVCVGPESGILVIEDKPFMVTVVVVTDGDRFSYGLSPGFEMPEGWKELIKSDPLKLKDMMRTKFKDEELGRKEGMVGRLTKGRLTREGFCYLATLMALSAFFNEEWRS